MTILICGDYCPQYRVKKMQESSSCNLIFDNFKDVIKSYDHAILNLECPLFDKKINAKSKVGPNLSARLITAEIIRDAGFGIVTLANNHILDFGQEGVTSTIEVLKNTKLEFLGIKNEKVYTKSALCLKNDGIDIGIINICETEFNMAPAGYYGAIPVDIIALYEDIRQLKTKTDYIVVIIHGGHEHYQLPSPRMKKLYRFIIDMGADVIVNHHQHCYSGYEKYNGGLIFYGLGNLCFDNPKLKNTKWNYGYMLGLNFTKNEKEYAIYPYNQCSEAPIIRSLSNQEKACFDQTIGSLNEIISNDAKLENEFDKFVNKNRKRYISYFSPYTNRYSRFLCRKGMLPTFLSRNKVNVILDMLRCESHRDISNIVLSEIYDE